MLNWGARRTIASLACVLISIAAFGCGGGESDDSGGQTEAEARNQALLEQAETETDDASQVEDALRLKLAPYYYAGVEKTFALTDGSLCSIGDVYSSEEELTAWVDDPGTLVSPEGDLGVRVEQFQGTEPAPCLKAVGEALDWLGGEDPPAEESQELTEAEFIVAADSQCREINAEVDRIFKGAESYEEQARALSVMRPGFVEGIETLETLQPPAELRSDYESYTTALRDGIEIMDRQQAASAAIGSASSIGEKVAASDKVALKRAYDDSDANYEIRSKFAKAIGFKECSSD